MPRVPRLVAFDGTAPSFSSQLAPALADDSAGLGARVIPASLHVSSATVPSKDFPARTVKVQSRKHGEPLVTAVAPSKVVPPQTRMVNASENPSRDDVSAPNSVLLVMHTQQIDEYGQVWNICVWRLTVLHPVDREVHKAITPKST
jgi:hypothetical protein